MPRSVQSLSSEDSSIAEYPGPQQLESTPQPRRQSAILRFTIAASSFVSGDSADPETSEHVRNEHDNVLGLSNWRTEDDWFGSHQIHRSLTAPSRPLLEAFPRVSGASGSDEEEEPVSITGAAAAPDSELGTDGQAPTTRRRESTVVSTIQNITKKLGYWDDEFHADRIRIIVTGLSNYFYLLLGFAAALLIYWGAFFDRSKRYKNVQFAVFIGETTQGRLPPILGQLVLLFFNLVPQVHQLGDFHIWQYDRLLAEAQRHNNTIQQEVYRQVHHQRYRGAFYIHENATLTMYEALVTLNSTFNPATELLSAVYETGSDYNGVNNYFSTLMQQISRVFASFMAKLPWVGYMMETLNSTQTENVMNNVPHLLTSSPHFQMDDRIPVPEQVVQAPLQIGLIYLCIFTFFQFVFSVPIHMYIASKIKGLRYVAYRIATAQAAYVFLSLSYVLLNTAFQISFSKTFGHLGFLVIWAFAFLTMSSVGSGIEVMVLFCIILKPAMIGVVLLFVAVLNLAPTISPIVLCPNFYRYGWAMPVVNSYELMQVAFFNSWKGKVGRNIGVLVAWIIVTNAMMPFAMKWMAVQMKKKQLAAQPQIGAQTQQTAQALQ